MTAMDERQLMGDDLLAHHCKGTGGQDAAEISRLVALAAQCFDAGEFALLGELFRRGQMDIGGLADPIVGAEGVQKFVEERLILHKGLPRTQHLIGGIVVTVSPDRTTAAASSQVTVLQGLDRELKPILSARYDDEFQRDQDGWYFSSRIGRYGMVGDLSRHLR
jgi:hypothetical protein